MLRGWSRGAECRLLRRRRRGSEGLRPAMKFVLACYGSRGDVEPCAALGRELMRRGHEVHLAVSPDLICFAESTGLRAVAFGPDLKSYVDAQRDFYSFLFRNFWRIRDLTRLLREFRNLGAQWGEDVITTLTALGDGSDLLLTGLNFEAAAVNVAEYHDIPLATLHFVPLRANGQLLPIVPAPLGRAAMTFSAWLAWRVAKQLEDAQRRELGLPRAKGSAARRIAERGSLEIQAYDEFCFPGLAAEWAKWNGQRPFVGALALRLPTEADDEVASWIAAGTPPIFFSFGSTPAESAADTLAMIGAACAQLRERALVCAPGAHFSHELDLKHVKVVGAMNFAAAFPACRAVVHHGGAGTTALGLRAGVPQLILSTDLDQAVWGGRVKRLKVGTVRSLSSITPRSLVADLRAILAPQYVTQAREIATRMTKPAESVAAAADLLESFARLRRVG